MSYQGKQIPHCSNAFLVYSKVQQMRLLVTAVNWCKTPFMSVVPMLAALKYRLAGSSWTAAGSQMEVSTTSCTGENNSSLVAYIAPHKLAHAPQEMQAPAT